MNANTTPSPIAPHNSPEEKNNSTSQPTPREDKTPLEPWPEPVNGAELLDQLRAVINRFLVLPKQTDVILAVWVLHTYVFNCFDFTPYLHVSSPVRECGKSTLAELLSQLCRNATNPGGMTAAAMYRSIAAKRPTLLLDEWDTLSEDNRRAALNYLNTGFKHSGTYTVCAGDDHEVKDFPTFCPKALFGLSEAKLPETTRSRCLQIRLHRKQPGQNVERLTRLFTGSELRQKCLRWANDNRLSLEQASPILPPEFDSRQQDISIPLLAIGVACGGHWPELVRNALGHMFASTPTDEVSADVEILADIRRVFEERKTDRLGTADLCDRLNGRHHSLMERVDESPQWAGWNSGRGISPRQLAERLRDFGIHPRNMKISKGKVAKGYFREDCEQAFTNYLPPSPENCRYPATEPENIDDSALSQPLPDATGSGSEKPENPDIDAGGSGVADGKPTASI